MKNLILLALLVGCEATNEITEPTKTVHPNWEYRCIETDRVEASRSGTSIHGATAQYSSYLEKRFNRLGLEKWEMIGYGMNDGINSRYVCFKRPTEE